MTTKVRRRLTTLLCADVEGYSRLMEADEAGTLATLRRYRAAMATLMERHDGRIVNTWGDAVIAEFASVVEAVQCAVETQQELSGYNGGLPEPQRMRFRIGIHLGDVMVEGDDVYGDGVNITARLQELAEPGGILISGPVYDQVHNKLSIGFDCLGRQQLKNVANPVTGYRVLQGGEAPRPHSSQADGTKGARYTATSRGSCAGRLRLSRLGMVHTAASSQRRDDRHRRLLVCDQPVQRPQPRLVSVARHGAVVDRFFAGREQEQAVVERGRVAQGWGGPARRGPVRLGASRRKRGPRPGS